MKNTRFIVKKIIGGFNLTILNTTNLLEENCSLYNRLNLKSTVTSYSTY